MSLRQTGVLVGLVLCLVSAWVWGGGIWGAGVEEDSLGPGIPAGSEEKGIAPADLNGLHAMERAEGHGAGGPGKGDIEVAVVVRAMRDLRIDPDKPNPVTS